MDNVLNSEEFYRQGSVELKRWFNSICNYLKYMEDFVHYNLMEERGTGHMEMLLDIFSQ